MKLIKENISIYDNDNKNNYKQYYIDILKNINEQLQNKYQINFITLKENNIICKYHTKTNELNKPIQILNCYEKVKSKYLNRFNWDKIGIVENEKEIKENCEIELYNKKINFCYEFKFEKEGKNQIKIISKTHLNNTNFMFYDCSSLISLDLSNFYSNNVQNMS